MRALGERVIARSQGSNPCLSELNFSFPQLNILQKVKTSSQKIHFPCAQVVSNFDSGLLGGITS